MPLVVGIIMFLLGVLAACADKWKLAVLLFIISALMLGAWWIDKRGRL